MRSIIRFVLSGSAAGAITGIFGSGGGLVLLPLLSFGSHNQNMFPYSVAIMLPICFVSFLANVTSATPNLIVAVPYFLGGLAGGLIASKFSRKIPVRFLHLFFGGILVLGGLRFLCS